MPTVLPPGSSIFFFSTETGIFNTGGDGSSTRFEETYTGEYITIAPSGEPLDEPVAPSYATAPAPTATTASPPLPNAYPVTVKDGIRTRGVSANIHVHDGIPSDEAYEDLYSTGRVYPTVIEGGWQNTEAVLVSDDNRATTVAPAGDYSADLTAKGFDFSGIPDNATIVGIRVTVERSKV